MKVALCFWGLTRSLKFTLESIHQHIILPLKQSNIEFKIFLHTYEFESEYHNPRANEHHVQLDFQEYKLLQPDYVEIDNQDQVKQKLQLDKYRSQPDPWDTNYASVDNFICAMYSKKRLGEMIRNSGEDFNAFVFLRPDVRFLNPLDTRYLLNIQDDCVYIPNFHLFPDFNDRFLICTPKHVFSYTNLFDDMLEFSKYLPLHSERFQFAVLTQKFKLIVVYIPIHFNRVRACGRHMRDYQPEKYRKAKMRANFGMKLIR